MSTSIHWFRRDLRLHDNPALREAARASDGAVLPVFILDDALLGSARVGPARVQFLLESLQVLDQALQERGSRLVIRHGDPAEELPKLARETNASAVYFNRDYTPFARRRDEAVGKALEAQGIACHTFAEAVFCEPDTVKTKSGTPYSVYAPYRRQWRALLEERREEIATQHRLPSLQPLPSKLAHGRIPSAESLGHTPQQDAPPGGETEGRKRLQQFVRLKQEHGIASYDTGRERPALPATSQLSAYMHMGCVATVACLRAALDALDDAPESAHEGIETWLGEFAWRDFYTEVMWHAPHVLRGAFKQQYDTLEWENSREHFAAWCEGRTGYPIVDAAMRQLNTHAWMHNRARMIVASFLVKDLLIDWRWGERYFLQQLVDADHAANNGNWQWIAGTGTDPQPYFRIFSPVSQGQRFDPKGAYVRQFVPELAALPDKYIHTPWELPASTAQEIGFTLGRTYPAPIVEHSEQRERALAIYKQIRKAG